MKEPRVNVAMTLPLSVYQWLAAAAEKNERPIGQQAKALLIEIMLREHDERRKRDGRTAG